MLIYGILPFVIELYGSLRRRQLFHYLIIFLRRKNWMVGLIIPLTLYALVIFFFNMKINSKLIIYPVGQTYLKFVLLRCSKF